MTSAPANTASTEGAACNEKRRKQGVRQADLGVNMPASGLRECSEMHSALVLEVSRDADISSWVSRSSSRPADWYSVIWLCITCAARVAPDGDVPHREREQETDTFPQLGCMLYTCTPENVAYLQSRFPAARIALPQVEQVLGR